MSKYIPRGVKPIKPKPGQESVWDYPRPPKLEAVKDTLRVIWEGEEIANTRDGVRILETSHPPVYYFPLSDVNPKVLVADARSTFCEFKGMARYYHLQNQRVQEPLAAWFYPSPNKAYLELTNRIAFYPSKVEAAWVGDQRVKAQAGDFYGGWITPNIVGPFKGGDGTWGW
ncbi:MAG TPA: hypothetical protein DCE41_01910 [Cytophagales bacterium]|nr:hypothetical protein [Cytophagales bacterium]HAP64071.1 hypothetical protein [Cytophagales bacterium]